MKSFDKLRHVCVLQFVWLLVGWIIYFQTNIKIMCISIIKRSKDQHKISRALTLLTYPFQEPFPLQTISWFRYQNEVIAKRSLLKRQWFLKLIRWNWIWGSPTFLMNNSWKYWHWWSGWYQCQVHPGVSSSYIPMRISISFQNPNPSKIYKFAVRHYTF